MRRFLSYLLLLVLLPLSCSKVEEEVWKGPYIELSLETAGAMETKADGIYPQDGNDDPCHENLIRTVDFFFYPDGKTDADATWHVRMTSGKNKSDVLRVPFTSEQINTYIFPAIPGEPEVTSCLVFAVVNYPDDAPMVPKNQADEEVLTGTSLAEIQARTVTTNFVDGDPDPEVTSHYQPYFLMSGSATLSLRGRNQVLSAAGTIDLERYSCKMTVGVNVAPQVIVGTEIWEPMLESMEIYLVDAVANVTLGGQMPASPTYFSFRSNAMKFQDAAGNLLVGRDGDYLNTYPFYMYPQKWVYGSTESPTKEPYLKLVLPWQRVAGGSGTQKQFYYKIVIPNDRRPEYVRQFVRNNWYHIDIDVSILGAETDEASVPISNGSVYIAYWQDKNVVIKNAEIGKARYLAVDQAMDTLYNIASANLPYITSHPVVMENIRAGRRYYGTAAAGTYTLGGTVTVAGADDIFPQGTRYLNFEMEAYDQETGEARYVYYEGTERKTAVWFTNTGTSIQFSHALENRYKVKNFDYSPYKITYTLVHADHADDTQYRQTQTIIQYPGIYIECTPNTDEMVSGVPQHWGYVYVNNDQYTRKRYDADLATVPAAEQDAWKLDHIWRVVHYSSGGRDMYKIDVTVLPEDSEFVLGDPRTSGVDNLRNDFATAHAISGPDRTLTWYHPTEASDRTINMIAPAYRISTKHSGTEYGGTPLEQARYRCASLQENGFPAGRWRLPTKAEIRFAAQLSSNGVFEWQFSGNYWSANGAVNVNKDNGNVVDSNVSVALIRCVYDSWYWGDDQLENLEQFTWADAE